MFAIPTLPERLPRIWTLAQEVADALKAGTYTRWPSLLARLEILTEPGWIDEVDNLAPGWRKIATIKTGITAKHTLLALAICLNLPEYATANENTCCEIEWAALLHDLDKEYPANGKKDASHAFRSAAMAARVLPGLGFPLQPGANFSELDQWASLLIASQRAVDGQNVHDHTHLPQILSGLRHLWGDETPANRILKAILFHQSLPTLVDWTNPVLLNDDELHAALTLRDMDVLGPLLIADSDAWNIFDEPRFAYLNELHESIAKTRQRLAT
jgi:hypothetical protein